jgi:hypothetical protein
MKNSGLFMLSISSIINVCIAWPFYGLKTALVTEVLIPFVSGLIGFMVVFVLFFVIAIIKNKKNV